MKSIKVRISITVDSNLLKILKEQADCEYCSLSQYINLLLKQTIEKKKPG